MDLSFMFFILSLSEVISGPSFVLISVTYDILMAKNHINESMDVIIFIS